MRSRSNSRSIRMSFPSSSAWPFFHSHDFRGAWEKRDCATAARSRSLDNEPRLYLLVTSSLESVPPSLSFSLSRVLNLPSHWFTPVARINLARYPIRPPPRNDFVPLSITMHRAKTWFENVIRDLSHFCYSFSGVLQIQRLDIQYNVVTQRIRFFS